MFLLSFPLPTVTFPAFSQYVLRISSPLYACFCCHFLSLPLHFLHVHNVFLRFTLVSCIFLCFCSRFHCLPSHFLRFHCILCHFVASFFSSLPPFYPTVFSCIFPCFCSHFLCLPSHFLHVHTILYIFSCFTFLFISSVLQYFPAFSHAFTLISSAYRHMSAT